MNQSAKKTSKQYWISNPKQRTKCWKKAHPWQRMTLQTARLTLSSKWPSGNFSAQEILKFFCFYILAGGRQSNEWEKRQPAASFSKTRRTSGHTSYLGLTPGRWRCRCWGEQGVAGVALVQAKKTERARLPGRNSIWVSWCPKNMKLTNITCRLLAVKSTMAGNLIIASFAHKRMRAFDGKT